MRILIVEDDLEAAEAMARGLTEAGYDCVKAPDGEAGLEEARKGGFDVLIVDRMMPRMDGVTLIQTLRRENDQTPVLFLSALGEINDRVAGLKAGGDVKIQGRAAVTSTPVTPGTTRAAEVVRVPIELVLGTHREPELDANRVVLDAA